MGILNLALLQIAPRDTVQGNLEKGVEYCRRARELGADIALFPEMWSSGYRIYGRPVPEWTAEAIPADGPFAETFRALAAQVVAEVKKAVVGKDDIVVKALLAILARGHLLLEDIPGVGKTTLAIAFSKALGLKYNRVQFTPDVMPSDLTGFSLYNKATGQMEYQPGALLCNLFLADELNRATSRTQSALLEAMEEGKVTVDGVSRPVPDPFLVVATQNPAGAAGSTQRAVELAGEILNAVRPPRLR